MFVVIVTWTATNTQCYTFAREDQVIVALNFLRHADPAPHSVTVTHTSESTAQQAGGLIL